MTGYIACRQCGTVRVFVSGVACECGRLVGTFGTSPEIALRHEKEFEVWAASIRSISREIDCLAFPQS